VSLIPAMGLARVKVLSMKKVVIILALVVMMACATGMCQKSLTVEDIGEPVVTDSMSTLFIPERYSDQFLSSSVMTGNLL
jgi:hypothetical protein